MGPGAAAIMFLSTELVRPWLQRVFSPSQAIASKPF